MKYVLVLVLAFSFTSCCSQKETTESTASENQKVIATESFTKIKMGQLTPFGNTMLKLKQVTNDSRCPEGTQCIWAGEVSVIVGMYDNGKFVKDINITFSPKDVTKNKPYLLFETEDSKYFATGMTPYPKEGSKIEPKEYAMEISIKPNA